MYPTEQKAYSCLFISPYMRSQHWVSLCKNKKITAQKMPDSIQGSPLTRISALLYVEIYTNKNNLDMSLNYYFSRLEGNPCVIWSYQRDRRTQRFRSSVIFLPHSNFSFCFVFWWWWWVLVSFLSLLGSFPPPTEFEILYNAFLSYKHFGVTVLKYLDGNEWC